ncbi:MAG: hypothetical protein ACSHX0_04765 [Akkermansiaceae bacterium]
MRAAALLFSIFLSVASYAGEGGEIDDAKSMDLLESARGELVPNYLGEFSLRLLYGVGTYNSLGDLLHGEADVVHGTDVYSLELGKKAKSGLWGLPIDVSWNGAVMFHSSDNAPTSVMQYNAYFKLEWTEFVWNTHVRTKFGVGEGVSWVTDITYSETARREGEASKRFLNYLDFSLSMNAHDLLHLAQMDHVFSRSFITLDDTWVVVNISHRSGAYGLYGDYEDETGKKKAVKGGDNIVMIGLQHSF